MSTEAAWWALACDWHESAMFEDITTPGPLLAWIGLLNEAKRSGRGGRFKLKHRVLCRSLHVTEQDIEMVLQRAVTHAAVTRTGDVVTFRNWRKYQDAHVRAKNAAQVFGFTENEQTGPTHHPSPTTHHTSQEELNAARSPASAAKPADSGGGKSPMSGGKTPTGGKAEQVTLDRERWVWVGTEGRRAAWEAAYPAVDIDAELAKAAVWCRENGAKGHRKNFGRFLSNWLSRQQERGGTRGGPVLFTPDDPNAKARREADDLVARLKARDAAKAAEETP